MADGAREPKWQGFIGAFLPIVRTVAALWLRNSFHSRKLSKCPREMDGPGNSHVSAGFLRQWFSNARGAGGLVSAQQSAANHRSRTTFINRDTLPLSCDTRSDSAGNRSCLGNERRLG